MELWLCQGHCWWGPGAEVVQWPPSLTSLVPHLPARWASCAVQRIVAGTVTAQPPQLLSQAWLVFSQGEQCPFSRGLAGSKLKCSSRAKGRQVHVGPEWGLSLDLAIFHKDFSKVTLVCHAREQPDSSIFFPVGQNNIEYQVPSCWLCEPAQCDDPSLTTNPFHCRKCNSLGSRKLYSNDFLYWERVGKMCLWENKWICPLLCCFVLNYNHKPETVPHPKSMLLQAFTVSIPSNSKSHWS